MNFDLSDFEKDSESRNWNSKKATVKSYTKIKIDVQIKGKAKCLEHVCR